MNLYVEGTTPNGEAHKLIGILKQKGQDGLVSKMEDTKDLGRVAPTGSVGTGVRFVNIRRTQNGGLHIIMATNRPMSFGVMERQPIERLSHRNRCARRGQGRRASGFVRASLQGKVQQKGANWKSRSMARNPFLMANVYAVK